VLWVITHVIVDGDFELAEFSRSVHAV